MYIHYGVLRNRAEDNTCRRRSCLSLYYNIPSINIHCFLSLYFNIPSININYSGSIFLTSCWILSQNLPPTIFCWKTLKLKSVLVKYDICTIFYVVFIQQQPEVVSSEFKVRGEGEYDHYYHSSSHLLYMFTSSGMC
jgi:hypothetical protein